MLQNILQSLSDSKSTKKPSNAPSEASVEAGEIFSELFLGAVKKQTKPPPLLSALFATKESPQTPANAKNHALMIPAFPQKKALPSPLIPLAFQKGATLKELLEGAKSALPKGKEPWVEGLLEGLKSAPSAPLVMPKGEKNLATLTKIATALDLNPLRLKAESPDPAKEALESSARLLEGKVKAKKGALLQSAKVAKEESEVPLWQEKSALEKPAKPEKKGAIPVLAKPEVVKEVKTPEAKPLPSILTPSLQAIPQSAKDPAPLEAIIPLEAPPIPSAPVKLKKGEPSPLSSALSQLASVKKDPNTPEVIKEDKAPSKLQKGQESRPIAFVTPPLKSEEIRFATPPTPVASIKAPEGEKVEPALSIKPSQTPKLSTQSPLESMLGAKGREIETKKVTSKEESRPTEIPLSESRSAVEARLGEMPLVHEFKKPMPSTREESEGKGEIKASEELHLTPANATESRQEILQKSALAKETLRYFSAALKEEIQNYKPPLTKLSLELNPEKLGNVELTITQRGQNLHVQVVSNPQAIQLFMNNAPEFRQQLANVGFSDVSMSFGEGSNAGGFSGGGSHPGSHQPKGNENGLSAYKANALGGADLEESPLLSLMELTLPRYA